MNSLNKVRIPEEVILGRIMATKMLVKKQAREIKQVETEILKMTDTGLEAAGNPSLEQIADSLREFYICIENAFGFIGHNLDELIPIEGEVHQELLDQMSSPFGDIRPPVIDKVLKEELRNYMQFRLDLEKAPLTGQDRNRIILLVNKVKSLSAAARQELTDFFEEMNVFHGLE